MDGRSEGFVLFTLSYSIAFKSLVTKSVFVNLIETHRKFDTYFGHVVNVLVKEMTQNV